MKENNKKLLIIIAVLGIIIVGLLVLFVIKSKEVANEATSSQNEEVISLNNELLPLYSGVNWQDPVLVEPRYEQEKAYWVIFSDSLVDVTNIHEVATPFTDYYEQKLTDAGWEKDISREASGPGSNVTYYTKNGQFIAVAFDSNFKVEHEDTPSECPCDTILSITNGVD